MPRRSVPAKNSYPVLLAEIQTAITEGLAAAERALEYQRVKTYWTIGRAIYRNVFASGETLMLPSALYDRIAEDIFKATKLNLSADTIRRSVRFYKVYPKFPAKTKLTYTHYLRLLTVDDDKTRARLEQKAIKENLSISKLKEEIVAVTPIKIKRTAQNKQLPVQRGELYVYSTRFYQDINQKKSLCVDCGWKIDMPMSQLVLGNNAQSLMQATSLIRVIKKDDQYHIRLNRSKNARRYTYWATVERVVDGDTFDVRLDVGFNIKFSDRMRLNGINAPELRTPAGKRAKVFLERYLAKCPLVVIRSYKKESLGRWMADCFVIQGCDDPHKIAAEGQLLNQIMIDEGHAEYFRVKKE